MSRIWIFAINVLVACMYNTVDVGVGYKETPASREGIIGIGGGMRIINVVSQMPSLQDIKHVISVGAVGWIRLGVKVIQPFVLENSAL